MATRRPSVCHSVCLFVRLSVARNYKKFRAIIMVSIDDQQEVIHELFKEPILGPLG